MYKIFTFLCIHCCDQSTKLEFKSELVVNCGALSCYHHARGGGICLASFKLFSGSILKGLDYQVGLLTLLLSRFHSEKG